MKCKSFGKEYEISFKKTSYGVNDNVAVRVVTKKGEPFCMLTVNLEDLPSKSLAYIDVNNCPSDIIEQLEDNGYIINMYAFYPSGYVVYPLYDISNLLSAIDKKENF